MLRFTSIFLAVLLCAGPLRAQAPAPSGEEMSAASSAAGTSVTNRFQNAPRPRQAPPGMVVPTASGGLGGATSFTQAMPLNVESLIALRRPFTNRPEFRGAWVTRTDWVARTNGKFDPEKTKARIVELMTAAQDLHLNALLFQVRGDATVLYPSKLEPFSKLMDGKDPGFDPLKLAIDEAHKRGIEFHAYVNAVPCSEEHTSSPASADHIWYKHCSAQSVPNWLVFKDGKPAPFNEYLWLNPNLPDVQVYIRNAVMDLVSRYDVDGVHFDRIRLPSPEVSDDPWSNARFQGGSNPGNLAYGEWETDNITRMLTDIYGSIMEIKPHVKVSAAVWGIYDHTKLPQGADKATGYSWTSTGLQDFHQDSVGWINRGCMDALVPMMYWNMGDVKPDYDELLFQFTTSIHNGRHVYGGQRGFGEEEMIRQVVATNLTGAEGNVPFTLNRIRRISDFYTKNIYPNRVPTPAMPWKSDPVFGHVIVIVKDAQGKPVTDAHVTAAGRKDVALSSADGLCAILDLLPGTTKINADKPGIGKAAGTAEIKLGKVSRVELTLKP